MEKAEQWRMVLEKVDCIHGNTIAPPQGKRLHLYFGTLDVSPRTDHPLFFDGNAIEAHDIHFTGDTSYVLWDDLTSVSIR